jgi:dipeptidyl aminopeptidase/acylaminoacyl peptidase
VEIGTVEGVTLKIDLVVHGDADRVVPVECSRDFVSKFKQTGGKVEYHELSGAGHNISATHPDAQDLAYAFLRKLNFPDQD